MTLSQNSHNEVLKAKKPHMNQAIWLFKWLTNQRKYMAGHIMCITKSPHPPRTNGHASIYMFYDCCRSQPPSMRRIVPLMYVLTASVKMAWAYSWGAPKRRHNEWWIARRDVQDIITQTTHWHAILRSYFFWVPSEFGFLGHLNTSVVSQHFSQKEISNYLWRKISRRNWIHANLNRRMPELKCKLFGQWYRGRPSWLVSLKTSPENIIVAYFAAL